MFALGPPILWDDCPMIPIKDPDGAVDGRHVGLLARAEEVKSLAGVRRGTRVECVREPKPFNGLPIFASTHSWDIVDRVPVGTQMVAAAEPVVFEGCPMVALSDPPGAVDDWHIKILDNCDDRAGSDDVQEDQGYEGRADHSVQGSCFQSLPSKSVPEEAAPQTGVWVPPRLSMDLAELRVVHFSGELKMWDWDFAASENIDDFVIRYLCENCPRESRLWLTCEGDRFEYEAFGVECVEGRFEPLNKELSAAPLAEMIDTSTNRLRTVTKQTASQWFQDLEEFLKSHSNGASPAELLRRIGSEPCYIAGGEVEVYWQPENCWYTATVEEIFSDDKLKVKFDDKYTWPSSVFSTDYIRPGPPQKGSQVDLSLDSERT
jgi:hypothetical protein